MISAAAATSAERGHAPRTTPPRGPRRWPRREARRLAKDAHERGSRETSPSAQVVASRNARSRLAEVGSARGARGTGPVGAYSKNNEGYEGYQAREQRTRHVGARCPIVPHSYIARRERSSQKMLTLVGSNSRWYVCELSLARVRLWRCFLAQVACVASARRNQLCVKGNRLKANVAYP
jgi:hypothetical protein